MCNGLPAYLVQVPAKEVHSDKFLKREEQEKMARQDEAKQHSLVAAATVEMQPLPQGAGASSGRVGAIGSGTSLEAGPSKPATEKKDE